MTPRGVKEAEEERCCMRALADKAVMNRGKHTSESMEINSSLQPAFSTIFTGYESTHWWLNRLSVILSGLMSRKNVMSAIITENTNKPYTYIKCMTLARRVHL